MLDLSDLVTDPDFATTFTVVRNQQTVGQNGLSTVTTTTFPDVVGVVTSEGNPLVQQPDFSHATNDITILTQMKLYDPTTGYQPDEIHFQGNKYKVCKVGNWSVYGFYQADCELIDLTSAP